MPTDFPESDGTAEWDATTIVLVEAHAGDRVGLGYTYGDAATGALVRDTLAGVVEGRDALAVTANWQALGRACRNLGRPGLASMAIAAVDTALWDLKARLLDLPLATLLDAAHDAVPIYGSGGFTSYPDERLAEQLGGWVEQGIPRVKMKVGREPERDLQRVEVARKAIGDDDGAVRGRERRAQPQAGAAVRASSTRERFDVRWFEEPVSSDDLEGLRLIRDRAPAGMEIAAGEYGYTLAYFERMLEAGAVDCLAGRRHPLRGDQRVPARRRALPGALARALGALRAVDPRPSLLRGRAAAPPRVLPRPRPRRATPLRRRPRARRRRAAARPLAPRERARVQTRRCRAVRDLSKEPTDDDGRSVA